jgi:hypothetical protein
MPGFPDGMRRILFDPENQFESSRDHIPKPQLIVGGNYGGPDL